MSTMKKKVVFILEKTETGFSAYAVGYPIFTTGKTISGLLDNAFEAAGFYFEETDIKVTRANIKFEVDFEQFFKYYRVLNSKFLAERINANPNLVIDMHTVQTNILLFHPKYISVEEGIKNCKEKGLLVSTGKVDLIRAITHLDVSFEEVKKAADIIDQVFN